MPGKSITEQITALYERLSRDDELQGDSNSIITQKKILEDYAKKNGFRNIIHFTDDGWSGTRFDRPGFNQMIAEVEAGKVGAVIVKDMSRLGRDYLQVGFYTEVLFREKDVRFVAVNDNVDSERGDDDFTPFRNVLNQMYARDCSRKVAASYRSKGNEGRHTGNHPLFGYLHDPEDKERWTVDEEAAVIVRRIFQMTLDGKGPYAIANTLQSEKVYCPSYYLAQKGVGNNKNKDFPDPYRWWGTTVTYLLGRMEYMGHTVNFKTFKKTYKDKNRKPTPVEKQAVFENTHEAIIDPETWHNAQRLRKTVRRVSKAAKEPNRLTGLLYCADCGAKLYNERASDKYHNHPRDNYICASYRKHTTDCTMHFVRSVIVEELILDALRKVNGFVKTNEAEFVRLVTESSSVQQVEIEKSHRKRLVESEKRVAELDRLIRQIYEDNVNGKLTDKRFEKLSGEYEREQEELEQAIVDMQVELDSFDEKNSRADRFLELTRRYTDFTELTTPMLNEFIEKVVVHERVKEYRYKASQRIDIYFNFVGMVELPGAEAEIPTEAEAVPQRYVASDTSFAPLAAYLEQQSAPSLYLPFSEVEKIIGRELCKSAYKYASYWYPGYNRPVSNVIFNSGYDVEKVDLKNHTLTLKRPGEAAALPSCSLEEAGGAGAEPPQRLTASA